MRNLNYRRSIRSEMFDHFPIDHVLSDKAFTATKTILYNNVKMIKNFNLKKLTEWLNRLISNF